jgi:hypothetical protein
VTTCHCDGPPHEYKPSWCGVGKGDDGKPIGTTVAAELMMQLHERDRIIAEKDAIIANLRRGGSLPPKFSRS